MLSTEAACKGESPMAQVYEEFQQELEGSKAILTALLLNLPKFQQNWQKVEAIFNQRVITLSGEDLEPQAFSRWQSLQTEIHREMKLLSTELRFWQLRSQGHNWEKRREKAIARLDTIIALTKCNLMSKMNN